MSEAVESEDGEVREGYKRVQLGPKNYVVPESWSRVTTEQATELITRGKQPDYADDSNIRVINQSCIYWDGFREEELKKLNEETSESWKDKYFVDQGDVLLNSTGKGTLGRAYHWDRDTDNYVLDSHVTRLVTDPDLLTPQFLRSYLESEHGQTMLYTYCVSGSTGQIELSKTDLLTMPLILPPLEEQRRIAEVLSTVDEKIRETEEIIETTEELKKGLVNDLIFTGIEREDTRQIHIGPKPVEIAQSWETKQIGEVTTTVQYGSSESLSQEGQYPMFRMNNIERGRMVPEPMKYVDLDDDTAQKYRAEQGDILFNRTNSIDLVGKSGIFDLDGEYVFASYLIRLQTNDQMNPWYLNYFINSKIGQDVMFSIATRGASQANINATNLKNVRVPAPPREEQDEIVDRIRAVEQKTMEEEELKQEVQDLKRGLMQDLLTGTVRVSDSLSFPKLETKN